jgi:STE24 endopeptidase
MPRLNEDRATRYHRSRRRARAGAGIAAFAFLSATALTGAGAGLARAVEARTLAAPLPWLTGTLVFTAAVVCLVGLARLPFDIYGDWMLERRYGLERASLAAWTTRHVRESLVRLGLACGAAVGVRAAWGLSNDWGWVAAAVGLWLGHLSWSLAMPLLLVRWGALASLESPDLVARLTALGGRLGVSFAVAQWHGGGAKHAHAILVATGRRPRVILSDALVDTLSDEEIEVVVAHELAHQLHGDAWKMALWRLVVLIVALGAAGQVVPMFGPSIGGSDLAALPLIGLVAATVAGLAAPVGLALSRRNERRADAFALEATGKADAFVSSMRRLVANNLIDERPTRLTRLLSSHPSVNERVVAALAGRDRTRRTAHQPRRPRARAFLKVRTQTRRRAGL